MKIIGLIGGMSWQSSSVYYEIINRGVQARLGGLHSAHCLLYSVDFAEIAELQQAGRWGDTATILGRAGAALAAAGAQAVLICTNTMHVVATQAPSRSDPARSATHQPWHLSGAALQPV